jgi:hypothetical protein
MKVKKADIAPLLAATYPAYKGRKFFVHASETVRLDNLNWDGGSRAQYKAVTLDGRAVGNGAALNMPHPADNKAEGTILPIPQGAVIAKESIYCGIECGITFYINPADMPRLLPMIADTSV